MKNKSIEERAIEIANECTGSFGYALFDDLIDACEKIATEQDRIARKEERERCIKAAQDWCCSSDCVAKLTCKIDSDEVGHPAYGGKCMDRVKIRKAIEEGGDQ